MYFLHGLIYGVIHGLTFLLVDTTTGIDKVESQQLVAREAGLALGICLGLGFWIRVLLTFMFCLILFGPYGFHGAS